MFNSQTSTNSTNDKTFIPVVLTLVDGERLNGAIAIEKNGRLGQLLNGPDKYVLFKTNSGEPVYLAQTTIAAVQSNEKPETRQLETALSALEQTNPYKILNVKPGADKTALRDAYHEQIKHYHPDQFANANLPGEVLSYMEAVIARLSAAYEELVKEIERIERANQMAVAASQRPERDTIRYFGQ